MNENELKQIVSASLTSYATSEILKEEMIKLISKIENKDVEVIKNDLNKRINEKFEIFKNSMKIQ